MKTNLAHQRMLWARVWTSALSVGLRFTMDDDDDDGDGFGAAGRAYPSVRPTGNGTVLKFMVMIDVSGQAHTMGFRLESRYQNRKKEKLEEILNVACKVILRFVTCCSLKSLRETTFNFPFRRLQRYRQR